ncbi:MAG: hypothetical protein DRP63_03080 [Planctomycetota bacterium]|nr:MAG: hypothetical protein DRP63_03080 [Planctomycetota bacterium]
MVRWSCVFALLVAVVLGQDDGASSRMRRRESRLLRLHQKLSLVNLINGLHMTKEQMRRVYDLNLRLEGETVRRYFGVLRLQERVERIWRRWYEEIVKGNLPKDLMSEVARVDEERKGCGYGMRSLVRRLAKEIEAVFTDAQKEVIRTFDPCTIPPKDIRNPVRAGQAPGHEKIIKAFRWLRGLPPFRRAAAINWATEKVVSAEDRLDKLTDQEKQKERQRVKRLLWKVVRMKDVDFELQKEKLAKQLIEEGTHESLKKKAKELERLSQEITRTLEARYDPRVNRLVRFFLNPPIVIPVLRDKLGIAEKVSREADVALRKAVELKDGGKLKEAFEAFCDVAAKYPFTDAARKALDFAEDIAQRMPDVVSGASVRR